jgi:hypothetical protein
MYYNDEKNEDKVWKNLTRLCGGEKKLTKRE